MRIHCLKPYFIYIQCVYQSNNTKNKFFFLYTIFYTVVCSKINMFFFCCILQVIIFFSKLITPWTLPPCISTRNLCIMFAIRYAIITGTQSCTCNSFQSKCMAVGSFGQLTFTVSLPKIKTKNTEIHAFYFFRQLDL